MEDMIWKSLFPKEKRPEITDLEVFMKPEIYKLFISFAEHILKECDLRFGIPTWSETNGWTYRIGKSGVFLITGIVLESERFVVGGNEVSNDEQYENLITYFKDFYSDNKESFIAKIAEKNRKQRERTAERIARERLEKERISSIIVPGKYNVFHWPEKLNIYKLNKLYLQDAKGIQDEELADEIGLTLYLRCKYGKEDMERMERGAIRCHGCGAELFGPDDFRQCKCGLQYSYKEYRRSFRRDNMPTGAAAKVFNQYILDWERAGSYQDKILLIDRLLHEFHVSLVSGATHRPVAMNFIDGSRKRVEEIILTLS